MTINWCWGEWWFKFKTILIWIKYIPYFDFKKAESLYNTIEAKACNPHDKKFEKWWNIIDFLRANYEFTEDLLKVLHWSNSFWRMCIATLCMLLLNTFWIKYFNWNYKKK